MNLKKIRETDFIKIYKFIFPDFIEVQECIFFKSEISENININNFFDKTEAETFINHFHINDLFDTKESKDIPKDFFDNIVNSWGNKLKKKFPKCEFIFFIEKNEIIRFHKVRQDEESWTDINDKEFLIENEIRYIIF